MIAGIQDYFSLEALPNCPWSSLNLPLCSDFCHLLLLLRGRAKAMFTSIILGSLRLTLGFPSQNIDLLFWFSFSCPSLTPTIAHPLEKPPSCGMTQHVRCVLYSFDMYTHTHTHMNLSQLALNDLKSKRVLDLIMQIVLFVCLYA